jgi:hypothetical protein
MPAGVLHGSAAVMPVYKAVSLASGVVVRRAGGVLHFVTGVSSLRWYYTPVDWRSTNARRVSAAVVWRVRQYSIG